ncbi:18kDa catalytic subunit of the signal peptidase complex [Nadsonia fulvescens var. elongata DSM 6958]|uniref:Signal peptidase complex catalytic subunit SEC11 n=1 Tax=Nadsonia fulvescens var. elongata DSM 6958 TaxID=857566 RepID=A0A1E3PH15_9ASCO|nr:18kDa catalytic subunit of the signal peptidase complex [Nadsonia fulvescens var. elongata DSM 6958]
MVSLFNGMSPRGVLAQVMTVGLMVTSAFMFWKGLAVVTNSPSPIVVVLSGSMEPAFQRGDLLFLWNRSPRVNVGDIVVYDIKDKAIPIVHRVMRSHASDRKQLLLTKGDNNPVDDLDLYGYKQNYLDREEEIIGTVRGYLPKIGYVTIFLSENAYVKKILLAGLVVVSLLQRE